MDIHACPGGCGRYQTDFACRWCWFRLPDRLRGFSRWAYVPTEPGAVKADLWFRQNPIPRSA